MKPRLVVGLGGDFSGDDAVGLRLATLLAADPRRPPDVEAIEGGADLLRLGDFMAGRRHVFLVDALQSEHGEVEPLIGDHPFPGLDRRQAHAHHLSAAAALDLLLLTQAALRAMRITWFLVPVRDTGLGCEISATLEARLPLLLEQLLGLLDEYRRPAPPA